MGLARTHTASDAASATARGPPVWSGDVGITKILGGASMLRKKGVSELGRANHGDAGARGLLDGYSIETRLRNSRCHRCRSRERSPPACPCRHRGHYQKSARLARRDLDSAQPPCRWAGSIGRSATVLALLGMSDPLPERGVFAAGAQNGCILPLKRTANQRRLIRDGGESQGPLAPRFSPVLGPLLLDDAGISVLVSFGAVISVSSSRVLPPSLPVRSIADLLITALVTSPPPPPTTAQ